MDEPVASRVEVLARHRSGRPIVRVACAGVYADGSAGNLAARAMQEAVSEALRDHAPAALVLDLSRLDYRWGDALGACLWKARFGAGSGEPVEVVVVARGATAGALTGLLKAFSSDGNPKFPVFEDLAAAKGWLLSDRL